jgi:hypothetical protein
MPMQTPHSKATPVPEESQAHPITHRFLNNRMVEGKPARQNTRLAQSQSLMKQLHTAAKLRQGNVIGPALG